MKKSIAIIVAIVAVVMLSVLVLTACGPASNPDKAVKALEKNGYTAQKVDSETMLAAYNEYNVETAVYGYNDDEDYVYIFYCKSSSDAKKAYNDFKDEYEKYAEEEENVTFGHSGKRVWYGTKAGVKAAR